METTKITEYAFPLISPDGVSVHVGMTLRDYFAAKAMQALILSKHNTNPLDTGSASIAYSHADAMLKARLIEPE